MRSVSPVPRPSFRMLLCADAQYAEKASAGERWYRNSLQKLDRIVMRSNELRPDLFVHLGDLIDEDEHNFEPALAILRKLHAPWYSLCGNHDFAIAEPAKPLLRDRLGLPSRYWHIRAAGHRLLFLDTNTVSLYAPPAGSPDHFAATRWLEHLRSAGRSSAQPWNAAMDQEQLQWLAKECAEADLYGERVLIFAHHPVWPEGIHTLWNAEEVLALLSRYRGVVLWCNGHDHAGHWARVGACHFLTLRGIVESPDEGAHCLMEIFPDCLRVTGWEGEISRVLPLSGPPQD